MEKHQLVIQKTNRYVVVGDLETCKEVLVILHGYGQLVEYFGRKFEFLAEQGIAVILPEGSHRFYLKGFGGRVGASWMTKEDRLSDIADNIHYIQSIVQLAQRYSDQISLLGFSQGGASAARWLAHSEIQIEQFILWASVFPEDVDIQLLSKKANKLHFVLGDKDEFFDLENQEKSVSFYSMHSFKVHRFEGTHDIDNQTLRNILL